MQLVGRTLTLEEIERVAYDGEPVRMDEGAVARMSRSRETVEQIVAEGRTVYGVNTGFGGLSDVHVPPPQLRELQVNLVRSHCCGLGAPLSEPEVRAMTLLRANVLALGFSGARPLVCEHLVAMLNAGVNAVVPEQGSVGASGDLAPLAHLALCAMGEGEAFYDGNRMPASDALAWAKLEALSLEAKEGLSLLNGTQAMAAVGGLALARALRLCELADVAGVMTLEALLGTPVAFDARIHSARPHAGQVAVAKHLRSLMDGSEIRESHLVGDSRVQDAYSLRCIPQVHGAVRDALGFATSVVEKETGAATDNPLVFENGDVLSGGNFHGAYLAHAFDFAAIALTDLVSISERRLDRLITPEMSEGLPPFLTANPGTGSGYMIAHVAVVSLLNECKVLSHPASTDNLPTSGGKEDHVSMGMTSALKLRRIVDNAERAVACELMAAAEGLEYRKPLKPGPKLLAWYDKVRSVVPRLSTDRPLGADIESLAAEIRGRRFSIE
ncbi:MAG: histidine ammonia-lyase [Fimbriimonadaceae bacterium]